MKQNAELVHEARGYTDGSGKRTTFRFDDQTWRAIDHIAALMGQTWAQWVCGIPVQFENRHTDVRSTVVSELMTLKSLRIQPEDLRVSAPLLGNAQTMSDKEFAADLLGDMTFVDKSPVNFGGFSIRTGTRNGAPCIWIKNNLRDQPHLVIPIPAIVTQGTTHSVAELGGNAT